MTDVRTIVWVQTTFVGFHRWKDAPGDKDFLRSYHRHVFHVKLGMEVTHADRQVEFFQLKDTLNEYLISEYENRYFDTSCEMIATDILRKFGASYCTVSEDGENGATVCRRTDNGV